MYPMTSTASNAPEIDDVKPSLNTFEMEVRNKIYPKELYKRQVRERFEDWKYCTIFYTFLYNVKSRLSLC